MSRTSRANSLATKLVRQGHPEQAFRILLLNFADDPKDGQTLSLMAEASAAMERGPRDDLYRPAFDAAMAAMRMRPDDPSAWRALSRVYLQLHAQPQARTAMRRAQQLDPNDWRNSVGVVEVDSITRTVTKSTRTALAAAFHLAPNVPAVHFAAAQMATASDRPRAALAHYGRVLELDPGNTAAINNIAVIRLGQGKLGEAAGTFVGLLAQDPTSSLAFANLRGVARTALLLLDLGLLGLVSVAFVPLSSGANLGIPTAIDETVPAFAALLAVVLALVYVGWIRSRAGVYFRRFIGSIPVTDKPLVVVAALVALVIAGLIVAAFTSYPTTRHIYEIAICALMALFVLGAVLGRPQRTRR